LDVQTKTLNDDRGWRSAPKADFCVIGEEVSHSLSPAIHNAAFRQLGLPYRYTAINVPRGEVASALDHLAELGYIGVNVTMPHKEEALAWLSRYDPGEYAEVQAVNTIRLSDKVGFNTDTVGFQKSLSCTGLASHPYPLSCLVLGAGGSARAVVAVLFRLGFGVNIWNRTAERAHELASLYAAQGNVAVVDRPDPSGCDLIVNCTSASKSQQALKVLWKEVNLEPPTCDLSPKIAYDLFYSPKPISFLEEARAFGWQTMDGIPMLVAQAAAAWKYWEIKQSPSEAVMEVAACAALKTHA